MLGRRTAIVALVMAMIFYASFDSGWFGGAPAPAGVTGALLIFTLIFGGGSWALHASGDDGRSQMFSGLAVATGLYGLGRLLAG